MFEVFEHTADLGLRISAPDLPSLLAEAGRALSTVIAGDLAQVQPRMEEHFEVAGDDPAYLLFDWLSELLYAFEARRMLFVAFQVAVDSDGLRALARGERFDAARHELAHEVKAITYHALDVRRSEGEWTAEVIVDI
jgi:SHS2 domain-containing protein